MKYFLTLISLWAGLHYLTFAQKVTLDSSKVSKIDSVTSPSNNLASSGNNYIPPIIPPSPMAMQLQKYGDYPIGHTTGIPEINIPIYMISVGDIKIPISISYHSSGFKPLESSGILGLGWALNAGGRISRTVIADPDELASTPTTLIRASALIGVGAQSTGGLYEQRLYLDESQSGTDMQADIFYYSFPSGDGKFMLRKVFDANNVYQNRNEPIIIPYRPLKISSNVPLFNADFNYFEIVDENGMTYRYGLSTDGQNAIENTIPRRSSRNFKTSWLLTDIFSQGDKDHVKINYANSLYAVQYSRTDNGTINSYDNYSNPNPQISDFVTQETNQFPNITVNRGYSASTHYASLIKSIEFNNGKVVFSYETGNETPTSYENKLTGIAVYDASNKLIQKHSFAYSLFTNDTKRYKLTTINKESVSTSTLKETHSFEYIEPTEAIPNNTVDLSGLDLWGFYNGKNTNESLIPGNYKILVRSRTGGYSYYSTGTADRTPDETKTKFCILKKITYPTGGYTEFDYESNVANWASIAQTVGGLRIKKITNNAANLFEYKTYEYGGDGCSGCGHIRQNPFLPDSYFQLAYTSHYIELSHACTVENFNTILVSSDIIDGSSYFEISPVLYSNVTEYIGNGTTENKGKTNYNYTLPSLTYNFQNNGRYLSTVDYWKGSNLDEINYYNFKNGIYSIDKKEKFDYTTLLRTNESILGQSIRPFAIDFDTGEPSFPTGVCSHTQDAFLVYDYTINTGNVLLTKKTITDY